MVVNCNGQRPTVVAPLGRRLHLPTNPGWAHLNSVPRCAILGPGKSSLTLRTSVGQNGRWEGRIVYPHLVGSSTEHSEQQVQTRATPISEPWPSLIGPVDQFVIKPGVISTEQSQRTASKTCRTFPKTRKIGAEEIPLSTPCES